MTLPSCKKQETDSCLQLWDVLAVPHPNTCAVARQLQYQSYSGCYMWKLKNHRFCKRPWSLSSIASYVKCCSALKTSGDGLEYIRHVLWWWCQWQSFYISLLRCHLQSALTLPPILHWYEPCMLQENCSTTKSADWSPGKLGVGWYPIRRRNKGPPFKAILPLGASPQW